MFAASKLPIFDGLVTSDKYHVEDKYGIANSATGIIGDYHVRIERAITSKDNSEGTLLVSFSPINKKILPIHKLISGGKASDGTRQELAIIATYNDSKGKSHKINSPSWSSSYSPELTKGTKEYITLRYLFNDGEGTNHFKKGYKVYLTLTSKKTKTTSLDNDGDSKTDETYQEEIIKEHKRLYLATGTGYPIYEVKANSGDYRLQVSPITLEFIGNLSAEAEEASHFTLNFKDGTSTTIEDLDVCGTTVSYLEGQSANTVHSYEITNIIDVNEVDTITISDITFDFKNKKNLTTK